MSTTPDFSQRLGNKPWLTSLSDPSSVGELRWFGMYRHRGMFILVPRSVICD